MRKNSLSREKDIYRVLRQRPFFSKHLTVKVNKKRQAPKEYRYTVIISKKVSKLAKDRNVAKRRIRANIRERQNNIEQKQDFVVIIKKSIKDLKPDELRKEIISLLNKAEIIKK